jgi:BirA family transcriptional regulator, biotin operon repressor / biotin---[acetyl-CoA-carboxylase] ligase
VRDRDRAWLCSDSVSEQHGGCGRKGAFLTISIRTVETTGSTNADLIALASTDIAEGVWLRAQSQTSGRGRMGRAWSSPKGNLYASTLVRLRGGDPAAATLALVAAIALIDIVRVYAPTCAATIKWPNDILIDGAKLAGILLERAGEVIVIGFGANLADHPNDLDRRATSLADEGAGAPDPAAFVHDLAEAFARWTDIWRGQGLAPIRQAWLDRAHPRGTALSARGGDSHTRDGLFDGLEGDGALRLRLADGTVHVIHAGDVFLI